MFKWRLLLQRRCYIHPWRIVAVAQREIERPFVPVEGMLLSLCPTGQEEYDPFYCFKVAAVEWIDRLGLFVVHSRLDAASVSFGTEAEMKLKFEEYGWHDMREDSRRRD